MSIQAPLPHHNTIALNRAHTKVRQLMRAIVMRHCNPFTGADITGGSDDMLYIDGRWNAASIRRAMQEHTRRRNEYRTRGANPAYPLMATGYENLGMGDDSLHPVPYVPQREFWHRVAFLTDPAVPGVVSYATITRKVPFNPSHDPGHISVYSAAMGAPYAGVITRFETTPATYPRGGRGTFTPGSETVYGRTYDGLDVQEMVNAVGGSARERALELLVARMTRRVIK